MKNRAAGMGGFDRPATVFGAAVFILVCACLAIEPFPASGAADLDFSSMAALLGERDAAMVAAPGGQVLFAHNPDAERTPASTIKVLTALAAFHYLKPDFRFTTRFFMDGNANLVLKGQGDPLLISEVVRDMAAALADERKGTDLRFNGLVLDNSFYAAPIAIPGVSGSTEPYDAPIGALCVNFNTVNFIETDGVFVSAEPQTPLLPMVLPGIEASGLKKGRITLSHEQDEITVYAGRLFRFFLEEAGFEFSGGVSIGAVSPGDDLVLDHRSRFTLDHIVARMLAYSNNFMANQVFVRMGALQYGPPGTLEKGVRAVQAYARNELGLDRVVMAEGSGISRENRITAREMLKVLAAFEPHHALMKKNGRLYFKTGHLKGVRTQVGYYLDPERGLWPYVVLLNTPGKSVHPVIEQLLRVLENNS